MKTIDHSIPRDIVWETNPKNPTLTVQVVQKPTSRTTYENRMMPLCDVSREFTKNKQKEYLNDDDMLALHQLGYNIILI